MISRMINGVRKYIMTCGAGEQDDDPRYADSSFLTPDEMNEKAAELRQMAEESYEAANVRHEEELAERAKNPGPPDTRNDVDAIYARWNSKAAKAEKAVTPPSISIDEDLNAMAEDAFKRFNRK